MNLKSSYEVTTRYNRAVAMILQPNSTETIYFTAPQQAGKYTFLCTFPGHYTLMQGVLNVQR